MSLSVRREIETSENGNNRQVVTDNIRFRMRHDRSVATIDKNNQEMSYVTFDDFLKNSGGISGFGVPEDTFSE